MKCYDAQISRLAKTIHKKLLKQLSVNISAKKYKEILIVVKEHNKPNWKIFTQVCGNMFSILSAGIFDILYRFYDFMYLV